MSAAKKTTANKGASKDPTTPIREKAASFPGVDAGTACNQSSFKTGKKSFLFIGPGAKGQGFKAMFMLEASTARAQELANEEPERFAVGSTGWVTARFTHEKPLPKTLWMKWLKESFGLATTPGTASPKKAIKKKATRKR